MSRIPSVVSALAICGALASSPALAAQRVFVASFGNDGNTASSCSFATPCRGFTAAMTVVDPGGEVVALDAAGYGAVTITKSVTITANPGFYAGIAAATGDAVTIATAGVEVILRGLNINGIGAAHGVMMTNGASLNIENCVISNFTAEGVNVFANATVRVVNTLVRGNGASGLWFKGGVTADVSSSKILDNGHVGIWGYPDTTGSTFVAVTDTVASGNVFGYVAVGGGTGSRMAVIRSTASGNSLVGAQAELGATLSIGYSMLSDNGVIGLGNSGSTVESLGNNLVRLNGTNTTGTITVVGGS